MKFNEKGQGATEYLIMLAIVVVIALVAVGVLSGIPGIGGSAGSQASQAYWRTADIAITSVAIDSTDTLTMEVKNNLADAVTVNDISLDGTSVGSTTTLSPGGSTTISDTLTGACASPDDSFSLDVEINYTNEANDAIYTFEGGGNELEGDCAE